jgi:hypothetical protein
VNVILDTRVSVDLRADLKLRDVIEAEQKGSNILRPERFENAVSYASALLSYFTKEQAEIRLVIDGEAGEFGRRKPAPSRFFETPGCRRAELRLKT